MSKAWKEFRRPRRGRDIDDFDVDTLNQIFALVIIGGRPVILQDNCSNADREQTPAHERIRFLTPDAFHQWYSNELYTDGNRTVTASQLWMQSPKRRQFQGIIFDPGRRPGGTPGGYYNLWQGFNFEPVKPSAHASCTLYLDHLRANAADGNEAHFHYILAVLADMIQRPTVRPGISLVFRGRMGVGKTIIGTHIGRLFESNYALVDDPRYIVGNFNAHLAHLLLLQADEGFWAGDKQSEGRLKGLITSEFQMIEHKGKDPIQLRNYVHLIVTSNADWVVPAGHDERRFAIFDVAPYAIQNSEYFSSMEKELKAGGYGALLYTLQHFSLKAIDLRKIPQTHALFEQKLATLSPEESWWFTTLLRGSIGTSPREDDGEEPSSDGSWPSEMEVEQVHRAYVLQCERIGQRHKKPSPQLGIQLRRLAPGVTRRKTTVPPRHSVWVFPPLESCRTAFERLLRTRIDWETGQPMATPVDDHE